MGLDSIENTIIGVFVLACVLIIVVGVWVSINQTFCLQEVKDFCEINGIDPLKCLAMRELQCGRVPD